MIVECQSKLKKSLCPNEEFFIQKVRGDGNCQFYAVGHILNALYDIPPSVQILRNACALEILHETPEEMSQVYDWMSEESYGEYEAPLAYHMRQSGMDWREFQAEWAKTIRKTEDPSDNNWGDGRTLYYLSRRFRIQFIVLFSECRYLHTIGDDDCEYQSILLKESMHYDAIYTKSDNGEKTFLFDLDNACVNQFQYFR